MNVINQRLRIITGFCWWPCYVSSVKQSNVRSWVAKSSHHSRSSDTRKREGAWMDQMGRGGQKNFPPSFLHIIDDDEAKKYLGQQLNIFLRFWSSELQYTIAFFMIICQDSMFLSTFMYGFELMTFPSLDGQRNSWKFRNSWVLHLSSVHGAKSFLF